MLEPKARIHVCEESSVEMRSGPKSIKTNIAHDRYSQSCTAGAFRIALGSYRGADGLAAAGAERVCDRPAKRQLDRTCIDGRLDWKLCVCRHAHERDVVSAERPTRIPLAT